MSTPGTGFARATWLRKVLDRKTAPQGQTDTHDQRQNGNPRKKITVLLSENATTTAFEELKFATGVHEDSEVFRNALLLHLTLLRARASGAQLFMKQRGSEHSIAVQLFADGS
jgi:hypothetical protein